MRALRNWLLVFAAIAAMPVLAVSDIGGVKFEDKVKVDTQEVMLNGAGIRTRAFFKVYSMALYLAEKASAAEGALGQQGAKRVHIVTLRDLSAEQFADALVDGMQKNSSEAEMAKLKPRVDEFRATLLALKEAPKGTTVLLDYLPQSGTRLTVNGEPKGKDISGEDFYPALLRIWLGDKPVQQDLKEALLGKGS